MKTLLTFGTTMLLAACVWTSGAIAAEDAQDVADKAMTGDGSFFVEELKKEGITPGRPVPGESIEAYQRGDIIEVAGSVVITGRAAFKNWGFTTAMDFNYSCSGSYTRYIVSIDKDTITERREYQSIVQAITLSEMSIGLTAMNQVLESLSISATVFKGADPYTAWIAYATKYGMDKLAGNETIQKLLQKYSEDADISYDLNTKEFIIKNTEVLNWVKQKYVRMREYTFFSGKAFIIRYKIGEGICEKNGIELADGTSTPDVLGHEHLIISLTSFMLDQAVLPKAGKIPSIGEEWGVPASRVVGALVADPSLAEKFDGSLSCIRKNDRPWTDFNKKTVTLMHVAIQKGGAVTGYRKDAKWSQSLKFYPTGEFWYDKTNFIVNECSINAELEFAEVSEDHLLFEAKHEIKPKIEAVLHQKLIRKKKPESPNAADPK